MRNVGKVTGNEKNLTINKEPERKRECKKKQPAHGIIEGTYNEFPVDVMK